MAYFLHQPECLQGPPLELRSRGETEVRLPAGLGAQDTGHVQPLSCHLWTWLLAFYW